MAGDFASSKDILELKAYTHKVVGSVKTELLYTTRVHKTTQAKVIGVRMTILVYIKDVVTAGRKGDTFHNIVAKG